MNKFCTNCGSRLNGENFCPNCGAKTDGSNNKNEIIIGMSEGVKNAISYAVIIILPIVYLILLFGKWFKLSIPYIGEQTYGIYDLISGISALSEVYYSNLDWMYSIAAIFILFGILVISGCIKTMFQAWHRNEKTGGSDLADASIYALIESALIIIIVLFAKSYIRSKLGSSEWGYFGSALGSGISDMIAFTNKPVIMMIISIAYLVFYKYAGNTRVMYDSKSPSYDSKSTSNKKTAKAFDKLEGTLKIEQVKNAFDEQFTSYILKLESHIDLDLKEGYYYVTELQVIQGSIPEAYINKKVEISGEIKRVKKNDWIVVDNNVIYYQRSYIIIPDNISEAV